MHGDDGLSTWRENVAAKLVRERDAAEARYVSEHKRAVFLFSLLERIEKAVGDPQHPKHRSETYYDLLDRMDGALGEFANAAAGDRSWFDQDFDFDAWEREYFGPTRGTEVPGFAD